MVIEYLNPPAQEGQESYGDYFKTYGGESVTEVEKHVGNINGVDGTSSRQECPCSEWRCCMLLFKWRKAEDIRPSFKLLYLSVTMKMGNLIWSSINPDTRRIM